MQAVRSEVQKRLPKEWSEQEIAQLTELWEELKNDDGNSLKEKMIAKFLSTKPKRRIYFTPQC